MKKNQFNISRQELKRRHRDGKIRGYHIREKRTGPLQDVNGNKIPGIQKGSKEKSWLAFNLAFWANEIQLELLPETVFAPPRQWRFDWCLPAIKVAIEYEGIFSEKSHHTTVAGYTRDVEKYNRANELGWRLVRVTALDYLTILQKLNTYMANGK